MTSDTDRIVDGLIVAEGGYVDHPADRGGPTKYGITRKTLAAWRRREATAADVRALTEAEARDIYRGAYVTGPGFDRIEDARLRAQVVDAAVLHGPGWAARRLQEVAGVPADGVIGPVTLRAVNSRLREARFGGRREVAARMEALGNRFAARRIRKLARIVARDPTQLPFLVGWIGRATSFLET